MTLSSSARQLYIAVLYGVPVPLSPGDALQELLDFGLVVPYPHGPADRYIALNPLTAATQRRDAAFTQIAAAMTQAAGLPESVQDLSIAYQGVEPASSPRRGAVEYVSGVEHINARISELVAACTTELLTAQPGGARPAETLSMALPRDLDAVHRGIAMRTLYRTSVRSDEPTTAWAAEMTKAGAHVRTLDQQFMRALVFDRRKAVIADCTPWTGQGPEPRRALIVHDEGLVQYIAEAYERDWSRASIWRGTEVAAGVQLTEQQRSIMRSLATGHSQAAVGAALGISERSVSAQLAEMRHMLGYASTTQMAFELGRRAAAEGWADA
jgi:DNA-binding CsgD family transcriptional regulator